MDGVYNYILIVGTNTDIEIDAPKGCSVVVDDFECFTCDLLDIKSTRQLEHFESHSLG